MKKMITITIDSSGATTVEAHGFRGKTCRSATAALERALGVVKTRRTKRDRAVERNRRNEIENK